MIKNKESVILKLLVSSDIYNISVLFKCSKNMVYQVLKGTRKNEKILSYALSISKVRFDIMRELFAKNPFVSEVIDISKLKPQTIPFSKEETEKILKEGGLELLMKQVQVKQHDDFREALEQLNKAFNQLKSK